MSLNTAWLKAHWYYFAAGFVGLLVLYELVKAIGGGASNTSAGGGTDAQTAALQAGIDSQNAQVNGQVEVAAYQASTANNAIAEQLQATEVTTAAQLDATNHQTEAAKEIGLATVRAGVQSESIAANAQVQETQIEGNTIDTLGAQRAQVENHQIDVVNSQVSNLATYSKHFSTDIAALAPTIAAEFGESGAAATLGASNNARAVGTSVATDKTISAGVSGISSILTGLFG